MLYPTFQPVTKTPDTTLTLNTSNNMRK